MIRTLVGFAAGVLVAATAAGGATGPAQIKITDLETSHRVAHPARGGVPGTVETVGQRLFKPGVGKPIGRSSIVCTWVDDRDRSCLATYVLPRGSIVAAGTLRTRLLYELPVVGGTGLYDNARGTLTVTASHFRPRREVLVFRLVG